MTNSIVSQLKSKGSASPAQVQRAETVTNFIIANSDALKGLNLDDPGDRTRAMQIINQATKHITTFASHKNNAVRQKAIDDLERITGLNVLDAYPSEVKDLLNRYNTASHKDQRKIKRKLESYGIAVESLIEDIFMDDSYDFDDVFDFSY